MVRHSNARASNADLVRSRIVEGAIRLFLEQGFDETSVEAVASAADVSRRSVFRYFETKEDIVLAWAEATGPGLVGQLDASECAADPVRAALDAVRRHIDAYPDALARSLAVGQLIERTPSLKARAHEKYLRWEDLLAGALIAHGVSPVASRMAAAIAIAGLRVAVGEWIAGNGRKPIGGLVAEAFRPFDTNDPSRRMS